MCETGVNQNFWPPQKNGVVWPNYTPCRKFEIRPPPPPLVGALVSRTSEIPSAGRTAEISESLMPKACAIGKASHRSRRHAADGRVVGVVPCSQAGRYSAISAMSSKLQARMERGRGGSHLRLGPPAPQKQEKKERGKLEHHTMRMQTKCRAHDPATTQSHRDQTVETMDKQRHKGIRQKLLGVEATPAHVTRLFFQNGGERTPTANANC